MDLTAIRRVIAQGQGEMPSFSNAFSPAELAAIAKQVVRTLGRQRRLGRGGPAPDQEG